jgi:predicted ribosomally synthesized peptide with SipW-like signal peptide
MNGKIVLLLLVILGAATIIATTVALFNDTLTFKSIKANEIQLNGEERGGGWPTVQLLGEKRGGGWPTAQITSNL